MKRRKSTHVIQSRLFILLSLLLVAILFIANLVLWNQIDILKPFKQLVAKKPNDIALTTNTNRPSPTPTIPVQRPTQYDEERGLIALYGNTGNELVQYFQAGTLKSGKYNGYKLILAYVSSEGYYGGYAQIFATKDDRTYIINNDQFDIKSEPGMDSDIYFAVNRSKIVAAADLDEAPVVIPLADNFALYKSGLYFQLKNSGKKDYLGNEIYKAVAAEDFSHMTNLPSKVKGYSYYDDNSLIFSAYGRSKGNNIDDQTHEKYLDSLSDIIVVSDQGITFRYKLTTISQANSYKGAAHYGNSTPSLTLGFKRSQVTTNLHLYDDYLGAFSDYCVENPSIVKNISDADLKKIGTLRGEDMFVLKDFNHALYRYLYDIKAEHGFSAEDKWFSVDDPNPKAPTFEKYVASNPLLFMRDPWGRFLAFGENYYVKGDGCGKPVIYLYPSKPTKVTIKFTSPMDLATNIPTYHNGWDVLAYPEGTLTDLQPQYTDCGSIDVSHFGSEYAKSACENNKYPYIYWAGKSIDNSYPKVQKGWVVSRTDLPKFLDRTLSEIGFNANEKSDMISYWVPTLLSKSSAYYKISFLQTMQMNQLAPLEIRPRPDVMFRLFLDWEPLSALPEEHIEPQKLNVLVRHGFTVVEWGGLQR